MQKKHSKFEIVDWLLVAYIIIIALIGIFTLFSDYDYFDQETTMIKQMVSFVSVIFVIIYYILLKLIGKKANRVNSLPLRFLSRYFFLVVLNIYIGWTTCLRIVYNNHYNPNNIMSFLSIALIAINVLSFFCYISELKRSFLIGRVAPWSGTIISILLIQIVIFFALIYASLFDIDRTSFQGIVREYPVRLFIDFLYFSTITFTTLGFGDITPVSSAAKIIVMVEVLLFVVYISIILLTLARYRKHEISTDVNLKDKDGSDISYLEGESTENDK